MAHEKVFGVCENKCFVEVYPKDQVYNKNEVYKKNEVFPISKFFRAYAKRTVSTGSSIFTFNFNGLQNHIDKLDKVFLLNVQHHHVGSSNAVYRPISGATSDGISYEKIEVQTMTNASNDQVVSIMLQVNNEESEKELGFNFFFFYED